MTTRIALSAAAALTLAACGAPSAPKTTDLDGTGETADPTPAKTADAPAPDRSYDADAVEARLYARITEPPKHAPKKRSRKKAGKRKDKDKDKDRDEDDRDDSFDDDDILTTIGEETPDEPKEESAPVSIDSLSRGAHVLRHSVEGMDVVEAVFVTDEVIVTAAAVIEGRDAEALSADLGALVEPLAACFARFHAAHGALSTFAMLKTRKLEPTGVGFYLIEADELARDAALFPDLATEIDTCAVTAAVADPPVLVISQLRTR